MTHDFVSTLQPGTKFFHPLPRDGRFPTLPFWLDKTEFNGYDRQSQNGYFTRIVLLGMLGGHFGADFKATPKDAGLPDVAVSAADFMQEVSSGDSSKTVDGIAFQKGMVLERLAEGMAVEQIW